MHENRRGGEEESREGEGSRVSAAMSESDFMS